MADQHLSTQFLWAIFVLYILQIRVLNAERNSTKNDECNVVGDVSLDGPGYVTDQGVVLVCFNNGGTLEWGGICTENNWDDVDAKVVCRQLGYYGGSPKAVQNALQEFNFLSLTFKDAAMDSVKCIGNETKLLDCEHDSVCSNPYRFSSLAGVKCIDKGNDGGGGFSNDFDDGQSDQYDNTWTSEGNVSSSSPKRIPTFVIVGVVGVIGVSVWAIIRCMKRSQQQQRQRNHIQNATVENFQMVPPNYPSDYQVGQHPPPGSAFPNPQQMYPPKSQAGQIMPQSYPIPYPTGAHQHPPPGGMMPPSQPNPYPTGGAPQYLPPAGMMPPSHPNPYPTGEAPQYLPPAGMVPPSQPNPYPTGKQQYPPTPGVVSPSQPNPQPSGVQQNPPPAGMTSQSAAFIPSNEDTDLPNCPPPSYDDTFKSDNQ